MVTGIGHSGKPARLSAHCQQAAQTGHDLGIGLFHGLARRQGLLWLARPVLGDGLTGMAVHRRMWGFQRLVVVGLAKQLAHSVGAVPLPQPAVAVVG